MTQQDKASQKTAFAMGLGVGAFATGCIAVLVGSFMVALDTTDSTAPGTRAAGSLGIEGSLSMPTKAPGALVEATKDPVILAEGESLIPSLGLDTLSGRPAEKVRFELPELVRPEVKPLKIDGGMNPFSAAALGTNPDAVLVLQGRSGLKMGVSPMVLNDPLTGDRGVIPSVGFRF